ncbi:DNA mismatch repair protein MutT [Catellatospora sp. TT07R-123]|uniref:NUDIX hydrolase n=1 Tax=Catellatospora sp. TT07R-123 TaxID=2733863 RepID=UPI001B06FA16|nr:NUDIX domain-containing protein [Catellatospora sp. TT07R-123]GHJ48678.1 DNA mismatch repair protein MutT [Catellatospora sp. TT07R-123]
MVRQWQRVSAYGLAREGDTVLLVQIGRSSHGDLGKWMPPGGTIEHGEHPAETVVREFAETTGLQVRVDGLLDVGSDHRELAGGLDFHGVFMLYAVTVLGGDLRPQPDGTMVEPSWHPSAELDSIAMLDAVRDVLRAAVKK